MPILHDKQKTPFAIHPYRAMIKRSNDQCLLKNTVIELSKQHGPFVHIRPIDSNHQMITCGQNADFLIGENIWHALGKPQNMIYCEQLPYQNQVLLVIVHHRHVYLDTKLPASELKDELEPLKHNNISYDITIYGDLPISQIKSTGKIHFEKTNSFTQRQDSLLCAINANQSYKLTTTEQALKKASRHKLARIIAYISILGLAALPMRPLVAQALPIITPTQLTALAPHIMQMSLYRQIL